MRPELKIAGWMIASLISCSAFATTSLVKPTTRIDFNKEISSGESTKNELTNTLNNKFDEHQADNETISHDKGRVVDLVDAEVTIGASKTRPVADRRFNSKGKTKIDKRYNMKIVHQEQEQD